MEIQAQTVPENAGFGSFYAALEGIFQLNDRGNAKRFWDANNTLYLPFGEMTITTFDFAILQVLDFLVIH